MGNSGKKDDGKRHIISALVENKAGVLARISGLFSARGFNIDSLAVGETEDPTVSRMTIVVRGDERVLEQVEKQLNKLIDVVKVSDFSIVSFRMFASSSAFFIDSYVYTLRSSFLVSCTSSDTSL